MHVSHFAGLRQRQENFREQKGLFMKRLLSLFILVVLAVTVLVGCTGTSATPPTVTVVVKNGDTLLLEQKVTATAANPSVLTVLRQALKEAYPDNTDLLEASADGKTIQSLFGYPSLVGNKYWKYSFGNDDALREPGLQAVTTQAKITFTYETYKNNQGGDK